MYALTGLAPQCSHDTQPPSQHHPDTQVETVEQLLSALQKQAQCSDDADGEAAAASPTSATAVPTLGRSLSRRDSRRPPAGGPLMQRRSSFMRPVQEPDRRPLTPDVEVAPAVV